MELQRSTYRIRREDTAISDVTLQTEGLLIGSLPDCDLFLNHPSVSRSHAGIGQIGDSFYITPLSPTNATTLNGTLVEERRALASGDVLQIGSFLLTFDRPDDDTLEIIVRLAIALHIGDTGGRNIEELLQKVPPPALADSDAKPDTTDATGDATTSNKETNAAPSDAALGVFWEKRKREAGKIARPTPLHPRGQKRLGKALYNWTPTTDLAPNRYAGVFRWGALVVALLGIGAAFFYANAFSPAPVSNPHTRAAFAFTPAVAREANNDSCTSCHTLTASVNQNCAACHTTEIFKSNMMRAHTEAGLTCTSCHTEHRGTNFSPLAASLDSCTTCHNDLNKNTYNGRSVHTAHGGVVGYPVENGVWTWKGIDAAAWQMKDAAFTESAKRAPGESERQWRVKQFHALHMYRVRAVNGIRGNSSGEVSCSSCHKSFQPIDLETPRTTCAACHNGKQNLLTGVTLIDANQANCTSCHVQHSADKRHWNPALMSDESNLVRQQKTADAKLVAAH